MKSLNFCIYFLILFAFSQTYVWGESSKLKVLITSDNSIYEQALFGLQSSFEGELEILYLDVLESENNKLQDFFESVDKNDSFVITIGKGATFSLQENTKVVNILFSMISNPKSLNLKSNRICGISMDVPIELFLQSLKDIQPKSKNVIAFYSNSEGEFNAEAGEHADLKHNLIFTKQKTTRTNFKSSLDSIKPIPSSFYIPPDPLYDSINFDLISKYSQKNSVILMSSFPAFVKSGATFGISPDYTNIGIETGLMANLLKDKKETCELFGIKQPNQFNFLLNEQFAKASGIEIPEAIKERSKKSKLFVAGIQLLNESKWKSAKAIFENLLNTDPTNKSLNFYHQITLQKISGTKIKEVLDRALDFYNSGNFVSAKLEYQKALSINPNLQVAKDGIQKSVISQSEKESQLGLQNKAKGLIFESIKSFLTAIKTYPQNSFAKSELESIRKAEYYRISELKTMGIENYQKRNYNSAMEDFEKILLLDPNDKTATEYLRLSILKKEAIINIKKRQKQ